jgi:replicative DNA helicase
MNLGTIGNTTVNYDNNGFKKSRKTFKSYLVSERFLLSIIKILSSDITIMRRQLINIKRFLDVIDRNYYSSDNHVTGMLIVCDSLIETKMKLGSALKLEDIIFQVNLLLPDDEYEEVKNNLIIPQIQVAKTDSIETELSYVSASLDQNLKYSYILDTKEDLYDITNELTRCSYKDFPEVLNNYRKLLTSIMNFFRSTDSSADLNSVMHTSDPTFYDYLYDTYEAIRNPASALQTGWVAMNSALGPRGGFQNRNLYIFHANTNSFKSALLLHLARMVKEYNAAKVMEEFKKTGKIPTILFIECENDFDEDNERLYKITAKKDIAKCTSKEELLSSWKHTFDANKEENPIDISMVHVDARSMSVDDIDRLIEIIEEEGYKVIIGFVDYIGLLKPRAEDTGKDNRLQLKNIADDLLSLAKNRNIPMVTAHQLNRSGGAVLTNLKMQGGANAISQMTNEYVGESYGIEQAVSWSMFIDIENHDGRKFLTCKRNKCRYQGKYGMEYFVYEIKEGIIIDDDLYLPKPLHFDAIPNTDMNMLSTQDIGKRGVIDIRDKPKTPPKGHTITIKPEESSINNEPTSSLFISILQSGFEWFNESMCDDTCDEVNVYNNHKTLIGSTEYVF